MAEFHPSSKSKVVFAPAVASLSAPARAEITAGTALVTPGTRGQMKEMAGWETSPSDISVPDVGEDFDSTIPGRKSASSATITFYDKDDSTAVRTALAEGTAGYMILMPYGDSTGVRVEVWPCRVSALNDSPINSANEAKTFTATFSITSEPNKTATCPAP